MYASKKKIGLLVGIVWYWVSWLFVAPRLITYFFETPNMLSEFVAELLTVGIPALLLAAFQFKVDGTKVILYEIDDEPIKNKTSAVYLTGVVSCCGLFFFVTYAVNTVQLIYGMQTGKFFATYLPQDINIRALLVVIGVNALMPAVFEEIIYRGLYFDAFRYNKKSVIYLVPSVVFAALHLGVIAIISAFLLGLMLIVFYSKFRSLKLAIMMHFIYNVLGVIFGNYIEVPFSVLRIWSNHPNNKQLIIAISVSICITLLAFLVALYSFVFCLQIKIPDSRNHKNNTTKKKTDVALSVCLITFALLTLVFNCYMKL